MLVTMRTAAADFDDFAVDGEAARCYSFFDGAFDVNIVEFSHITAIAADEKMTGVRFARMSAADKGVEAGDAVDEAILHQEVESAVDCHGRGLAATGVQARKNVVSADGRVARPHGFQDLLADFGEARPPRAANIFRGAQGIGRAVAMIVLRLGEIVGGFLAGSHGGTLSEVKCYNITFPMTKRFRAMPGWAFLALLVLGCGASQAAAPRVVASIKPIHALVAGVMAGVGSPALLVQGNASPHAYSLKPSDAKMLTDADAVFWVGPDMEMVLAKALASLPGNARVVALIGADGVKTSGMDGHIWLDIENAKAMVTGIVQTLAKIDRANAERYAANASRMDTQLSELDTQLRGQLSPIATRPFIVFHDAYRYFTNRYGLNLLAAVTVNPEQPPGGRHVTELKALIARHTSICVFAEPQFQAKLMSTLQESAHVRSGVLDPEGRALKPGPRFYADLMHDLADNLVRCLAVP